MRRSRAKSTPRICPSSAGILMTPREFDAITNYDDRYRYELVHEVLVVTPIAAASEADANEELVCLLRGYGHDHPEGRALDKTLPERYVRTSDSRRRADRLIWAGLGRVPDLDVDVPTIAVEFVSRAKRDRVRDSEEKRREYLAIGIAEYWVIDRFHRTLTVYRNQPDTAAQVIREAETYRTALLPGFELSLARLLAIANEWK